MKGLAKLLKNNDLSGAMNSIPWAELEKLQPELTPELRGLLEKSAFAAAEALPKGMTISFDVMNPEAVNWVRAHAAELVEQNIIPTSQQAIREIIERAFEEGMHPFESARLIREQVGILPRHAKAVDTYRKMLLTPRPEGKGLLKTDADRLAMQYARQLINYRSKVIARHETLTASNEGQRQLWKQAKGEDLISDVDWERKWIITPDEKLCSICVPLRGERAPIDGIYPSGYRGPPEPHPQCRCAEGLARKKKEKVAA